MNRAAPGALLEADDLVGESGDHGLSAQRLQTIRAGGAIEQADDREDRRQQRSPSEPFPLVGLHHAPRMVVAGIVGVREQPANMAASAHVAVPSLTQQAR